MSSEFDISAPPSADVRMLTLARVLDWTATAAVAVMPVLVLVELARTSTYFARNVDMGAARVATVFPLLLMSLVKGIADAFAYALRFGFIWFFARYFACVLRTKAESLRAGEQSAPLDAPQTDQQ